MFFFFFLRPRDDFQLCQGQQQQIVFDEPSGQIDGRKKYIKTLRPFTAMFKVTEPGKPSHDLLKNLTSA